jgi:hypothetical protein
MFHATHRTRESFSLPPDLSDRPLVTFQLFLSHVAVRTEKNSAGAKMKRVQCDTWFFAPLPDLLPSARTACTVRTYAQLCRLSSRYRSSCSLVAARLRIAPDNSLGKVTSDRRPICYILVLGRVNDSSSHDSILLAFFAREREDSSLCQRLASRDSLQIFTRRV